MNSDTQQVLVMPKLSLRIARYDGDTLISDREEEAHSWVRNAWNLVFGILSGSNGLGVSYGAGNLTGRNMIGTIPPADNACIANGNSMRIYIGTGPTGYSLDDFTLDNNAVTGWTIGTTLRVGEPTYNATTHVWSTSWTREFRNMTGLVQTITEVGFGGSISIFSPSSGEFLLARDLLVTPEVVNLEQRIFMTYTIEKDFSAID